MTMRPCKRRQEVLHLVARGHWPHACPSDLRAHLDDCRSCAELLLVTDAFQQFRTATEAQATLPAPGAIWWRAQLRRRNAAMERVGKPILGAYVFALALTVMVAAGFAISQARHGLRWLEWADDAVHGPVFSPSAWLSSGGALAVLIPVLATVALVGAVVVYLAVERQ